MGRKKIIFKVMCDGEIYNAKRFKDLTKKEVAHSTYMPNIWEGNEIFVKVEKKSKCLKYMFDSQVQIIDEGVV